MANLEKFKNSPLPPGVRATPVGDRGLTAKWPAALGCHWRGWGRLPAHGGQSPLPRATA